MTGEQGAGKEQHVLDARMEYGLLATSLISLANMFWVGYGAFFTINTLLATGLGLSHSAASHGINATFLNIVHVVIPITGMFISCVAISAAYNIRKMQRLVVVRGRELEKLLFARTFSELKTYSESFPTPTAIGSILFGVIWAGALYAAFR